MHDQICISYFSSEFKSGEWIGGASKSTKGDSKVDQEVLSVVHERDAKWLSQGSASERGEGLHRKDT